MAAVADKRPYRPWLPVTVRADNNMPLNDLELRKSDCVALQAVAAGVANEDQQKRAFAAILHITGISNLAWMPTEHGGDRDTTFAAGKQHVGLQLRKLTTISLSILTGENDGRRTDGTGSSRRSGKPADGRNTERARQR
jgi:hypothetical protein